MFNIWKQYPSFYFILFYKSIVPFIYTMAEENETSTDNM